MSQKGRRDNKNKLRYNNLPLWLIKPAVEVGHFGETKYDSYNFLKGLSVSDTINSLYRHLEKVDNPETSDYDEESNLHHLAHVAWNALVAIHFIQTRPDLDDRYKTLVQKERSKQNAISETTVDKNSNETGGDVSQETSGSASGVDSKNVNSGAAV